jgi:hypothetical protein
MAARHDHSALPAPDLAHKPPDRHSMSDCYAEQSFLLISVGIFDTRPRATAWGVARASMETRNGADDGATL